MAVAGPSEVVVQFDFVCQTARQFAFDAPVLEVEAYGDGLINDTYLVTTESGKAILQRINQRVFPRPVLIMENLRTVLDHVGAHELNSNPARNTFRLPVICPSNSGRDYFVDAEGGFWRALSFIDNTRCFNTIADLKQAEEVGFALGRFHGLLSDLEPARLHDTLPGFHITPHYLQRFDQIAAQPTTQPDSTELQFCMDVIETQRAQTGVLEEAKANGRLSLRIIHGDPKLNNILFDADHGQACSMIDLDTVKPGLIHYDIGDCLRSCCNKSGESGTGVVEFDLEISYAIIKRYFKETRHFLTESDYEYLYPTMRLIPFELGLRFVTDYLEGNLYFKVNEPEQNLRRAVVQFQLAASVERQERVIKDLVDEARCMV
ncbi:MAG: aminoglycoside phosphotransferase family protein [Candidatus Competibacteraceae bacterium]|jgi:Ser/Thr protein kinase RdoA (MazF antagonist)|nr:aminoglycoside phosphotransferase family protein [Candidatus Competibacteraceae bacterium]